jgi:carbon-monoxide dehydrogenase large subunit
MSDMKHIDASGASIGSPVERIEDLRLLRGRGSYVDDLTRTGMLHAVILRSSVAHGLIRSIDVSAALALPGVHAVITAALITGALKRPIPTIPLRQEALPQLEPFEQPVIADMNVRYVGEPIAVVVADDAALAEDALEAIALDIESLPAIADRAAAAKKDVLLFEATGTNCALTLSAIRGDADAVFADAPYKRRERFRVHRHTAVPMETRGLLAEWDATRGKITVLGASKVPFPNRRILAAQMGLSVEAIEMVEGDTGGAFGVRGEFYPEDFLIPFAARHVGRPVKWIEDRREHLIATNHARDAECELEIACDRHGTILALRGHAYTDVGAYLRTNGVTPSRNVAQVSSGPYRIPHVHVDVSVMLTNKTPVGTYRAPGRFETDFFRERLFDMAAADLGIDRVEFRRRNLIAEKEMPYALATVQPFGGETSTDSGNYQVTLDRCLQEFDWTGKAHLNGKMIDGRYHGLGIGCYIEGGASGPKESARLVLETDGTVSVYTGSSAVGQGLETVLTQIAADALAMPMASIRGVFHGSTSGVKEGFGSYSSRSTVMGGSAIVNTARALLIKIKETAAARFGCSPADIEIIDGREVRGPGGKSVTLAELAPAPLSAEGSFASNKRTYSYGAHAAHVAVNPRTGHVELIDYVAVEDVGRIINPHTLHGQTVGAIVQGLGGVFLEHLVYDDEAQPLIGSLADYLLPTASDFPNIRVVALELYPSPNNPLGAKGAGEGGVIPVGGVIANAVAAALGSLGVQPRELPLSPPRVWQLIKERDERRDAGGGMRLRDER